MARHHKKDNHVRSRSRSPSPSKRDRGRDDRRDSRRDNRRGSRRDDRRDNRRDDRRDTRDYRDRNKNTSCDPWSGFREGSLATGLGYYRGESDYQAHKRFISDSERLMKIYQEYYQTFAADYRRAGNDVSALWEIAKRILPVNSDFCSYMHPVGISRDHEGDIVMGDAKVCTCLTEEWRIPDCFLRAFCYLLLVNQERSR